MKLSVLGCGRWGSFIAWYAEKLGHKVMLWGREKSSHLRQLMSERRNDMLEFSQDTVFSSDLSRALEYSEYIFISISSQELRALMKDIPPSLLADKTIILCMKGLEEKTSLRLSEVTAEYLPHSSEIAVWVGPGHVQNFANDIPNCMVIDSHIEKTKKKLVHELSSKLIRFYYGSDMIGNEIGAASKNVIGIAAGILDGLGFTSLKGALMARGSYEISRLIKAMGGKANSAYGLAHLGDYEATVFSKYSRNRTFGELFVQGKPFDKLTEGISTAKAIVSLGEKLDIDLPICNAVNSAVNLGKSSEKIFSSLFLRNIKDEFYYF